MPIVLVHQGPSLTQERYEETVRKLAGKNRMESPADWPVEGLLVHVAGPGEGGFRGCRRMGVRGRCPPFWREAHAGPAGGRRRGGAGDLFGAHVCLGLTALLRSELERSWRGKSGSRPGHSKVDNRGPDRSRTDGLRHAMAALYQLSYGPNSSRC
jgi:hypothetical protein